MVRILDVCCLAEIGTEVKLFLSIRWSRLKKEETEPHRVVRRLPRGTDLSRSRLRLSTSTGMKHYLLVVALVAAVRANSTPSRPFLALSPRESTSSSLSTSPCARYLSTIGVATLSDVYLLDELCFASTAISESDDKVIQLNGPLSSSDDANAGLSRLLWLHLPRLDPSSPSEFRPETSFDSSSPTSSSAQHAFGIPLPWLPVPIVSLPSNGDAAEGSLYLLSPAPAIALEQLDLLTSHPSTALLTLVSIPVPSASTSASSGILRVGEPQFPEVPSKDVARVEQWLQNLEFEPLLSALLAGIKRKAIERDVRVLSGEDQSALKEDRRVSPIESLNPSRAR